MIVRQAPSFQHGDGSRIRGEDGGECEGERGGDGFPAWQSREVGQGMREDAVGSVESVQPVEPVGKRGQSHSSARTS